MNSQWVSAKQALTCDGWRNDIFVEITLDGTIGQITTAHQRSSCTVDILLPAMPNLHSHAFQRAFAGLTEYRGDDPTDSFWTWRQLMYALAERLDPEQIQAIGAMVHLEMLEAGFGSVGEFHYLHHQADGIPYDDISELSRRMLEAAKQSGIGYTHLPVLYMYAGPGKQPLSSAQQRFGNTVDQYAMLCERIHTALTAFDPDFKLGVAPHSLRAVDLESLAIGASLVQDGPIHIHIAEQIGEVDAIRAAYGARPVDWLLDHVEIDNRWCLVHATYLSNNEIGRVIESGATVGLCPMTEANLGDGIFAAKSYVEGGGYFGIGSDSNVRISVSEELRLLEYSQRLTECRRVTLADDYRSCGRLLYEEAAIGGARAIGRNAGRIETGALADLLALQADDAVLGGLTGDTVLDAWVFAGDNRLVNHVWSAGRHVVQNGAHIHREQILTQFSSAIRELRSGN